MLAKYDLIMAVSSIFRKPVNFFVFLCFVYTKGENSP